MALEKLGLFLEENKVLLALTLYIKEHFMWNKYLNMKSKIQNSSRKVKKVLLLKVDFNILNFGLFC